VIESKAFADRLFAHWWYNFYWLHVQLTNKSVYIIMRSQTGNMSHLRGHVQLK
jgi:hypothetical protein